MNRVRLALVGAGMLIAATTGLASADQVGDANAFLCPVVGEAAGGTFLPGKNQAGGHANQHALNSFGDGTPNSPGNVPGAEGFTPLWNPAG